MRVAAAASALALLFACGGQAGPEEAMEEGVERSAAVQEALSLAGEYVAAYYDQFPEDATELGYPDAPQDRFSDRGAAARAAWEAREDEWLRAVQAIDARWLAGTTAEVPLAYLRERLEAAVGRRVCRADLWNVSPTWTGWHNVMALVLSEQAVDSREAREALLARVADVPRFVTTEIENLREGMRLGVTPPRTGVQAVLGQVDAILGGELGESPFYEPASRSDDPSFETELRGLVLDEVHPAVARYRDFLAGELLPAARPEIGVASLAGGEECYAASVRFWSSLSLPAEEIHRAGLEQMERLKAEMEEIGRRSFGTGDLARLLEAARTDPRYTFRTADEILAYCQAAVDRAHAALPDWFGFVPDAPVVIRPYPAYLKISGGGFYSAGAIDGSRPGLYQLGTYRPETISKAGMEATAFHETWPGHHLQASVALEKGGIHPITRYFYAAGFDEGWALYTERLADEMGLYSSDIDRLGMLSAQALRAGRLVVDPGMHVLGWTRQQAIDYLLANTAEPESAIVREVDRYIAVPGQATSYMLGSLRIAALRDTAERRLGDSFDVREFHDRVLGSGSVTLGILAANLERWLAERE